MRSDNLSKFLSSIASNYGGPADVHFARPGTFYEKKGSDYRGEELGLGNVDPRTLHTRTYRVGEGGISGSRRSSDISKGSLAHHYSDVMSASVQSGGTRVKNLVFAYDPELTERSAYSAIGGFSTPFDSAAGVTAPGALQQRAPVVGVRQLVAETFPEINTETTRIEDVASHFGIKYGRIEGGSMDPNDTTRVLKEIVNKVHSKSPNALRTAIESAGFGAQSIVDRTDPHNIASYMGMINSKPAISERGANAAIHIQGRHNFGKFTNKIGTVHGRNYAAEIARFGKNVFEGAGNPEDIAFLMTKDQRVFIGMGGNLSRYYELPVQSNGVVRKGGKFSGARPLGIDGQLRSVVSQYFNAYQEGMAVHGRGYKNLAASLEKGHIEARKASLAFGYNFSDLTDSLSNMGKLSLHSAVFDQDSVIAGEESLPVFKGTVLEGIGSGMKRGNLGSLNSKLQAAAIAELNKAKGYSSNLGVNAGLYHMIKAKQTKGVYAKGSMRGYLFPGTITERDLKKGKYHIRGRAEITAASQIRRIAQSRAALGVGGPSPVAVAPRAYRAEQKLARAYSKISGRQRSVLVEMNTVMGVVGGHGTRQEMLFGDSGAMRTSSGAKLYSQRHSFVGTEVAFGKKDVKDFLSEILGNVKGKKDLIEAVSSGQSVNLTDAIPFSQERAFAANQKYGGIIPKGAAALGSIGWDERTRKFNMSFLSKEGPGSWSSILINDARITAQEASRRAARTFGDLAHRTDLILSQRTAADMGVANVWHRHMLGLTGTTKGQKAGGAARFLSIYNTIGGKGLSVVPGTGRVVPVQDKFNIDEFLKVGRKTLALMGFSRAQIYGLFESSNRHGPGMAQLLGKHTSENLGNLGSQALPSYGQLGRGDWSQGLYAFLGSSAQREGADSDVLKQSTAFRSKIQSLNLMGQSIKGMFGVGSVEDHPAYARMLNHFEKTVGMKLSRTDMSPQGFVTQFPEEIKRLTNALNMNPKGSKFYQGSKILSRKEAAKRFIYNSKGGINISALNASSNMSISELNSTKLLEEGRRGFYLDMGDKYQLPIGKLKEGQTKARHLYSRYIYIPDSKTLKTMIGPGMPERDSLLGDFINLLQQPNARSGDPMGSGASMNVNRAFYSAWQRFAASTAKGGFMGDSIFASSAVPGAVRGRPINLGMFSSKLGSKNKEYLYTVEVGAHTIKKMAKDLAKEMSLPVGEVEQQMFQQAHSNKLYGAVTPRPQHGSSHLSLVKIRINSDLTKSTEEGRHAIGMHPFHASTLNRDFDKDSIELMALHSSHYKTSEQMEKLLKIQNNNSKRRFNAWATNLAKKTDRLTVIQNLDISSKKGMKLLSETALSYFGFGETPALSFMGAYANLALGGELANPLQTDGMAATRLNRLAGSSLENTFDAVDVQKYRNLFSNFADNTVEGAFQRAIELQRNVLQAGITKGGENLPSLINDYLNIPYEISEMAKTMGDEDLMRHAIERTEKFFTSIAGGDLSLLPESEAMTNLFAKIQGGFDEAGNPTQALKSMAKTLGSLTGVVAIANAKHAGKDAAVPHVIRESLGKMSGSLENLWAWVHGASKEDLESSIYEEEVLTREYVSQQQSSIASEVEDKSRRTLRQKANDFVKKSEVLDNMMGKLKGKWGYIGGAAAALAALRAISGLSSPAPIPREPLITDDEQGHSYPSSNHSAHLMPNQGHGSNLSMNASYSSESMSSDILNRGNSFSTVNINDGREFRSNFQMYEMQKRRSSSDFTHQYQS